MTSRSITDDENHQLFRQQEACRRGSGARRGMSVASGLVTSSVCSQLRSLASGEVTSVELIEAHFERIRRLNGSLNAVVTVCEDEALMAARAVDATPLSKRGPLAGVAMTIKDSLDTRGVATSWGTIGRKGFVPDRDAEVVRRLKAAGAVLVGKTNTPELTLSFETDNAVFGKTSNPYDSRRSPGGSSGGSAVSVATAMASFDMGSDYGGSIRVPAHWTGVAGIKPTAGRVPRTGHCLDFRAGVTESFQTLGPIARSVEDLALLLPLIAGPDGVDPYVLEAPPLRDLNKVDVGGLRIGYDCDRLLPDSGLDCEPTEDVRAAVMAAVAAVKEATGAEPFAVRPPDCLADTQPVWRGLALADGGLVFKNAFEKCGTPLDAITVDWVLARPVPASGADVTDLLVRLADYRSDFLRFFNDMDVLIWPVTAHPASLHGEARHHLDRFAYTYALNLTGHPSVVVRAGTSATGLPIGVQIVAPHWREDLALAVALVVEQRLGGGFPTL